MVALTPVPSPDVAVVVPFVWTCDVRAPPDLKERLFLRGLARRRALRSLFSSCVALMSSRASASVLLPKVPLALLRPASPPFPRRIRPGAARYSGTR